jgi:hypothetical protein
MSRASLVGFALNSALVHSPKLDTVWPSPYRNTLLSSASNFLTRHANSICIAALLTRYGTALSVLHPPFGFRQFAIELAPLITVKI